MTAPAAPARTGRPAHLNHRRHLDLCPDCWNGLPCRTEQAYARKAEIEDGHLYGFPADERGPR